MKLPHYVFVVLSLISVSYCVDDALIAEKVNNFKFESSNKKLCVEVTLNIITRDQENEFWNFERGFSRAMGVSYKKHFGLKGEVNQFLMKWMIYCGAKNILRSLVSERIPVMKINRLEDAHLLVEAFDFPEIVRFFSTEKLPFILSPQAQIDLQNAIKNKYSKDMNEFDHVCMSLLGAEADISRFYPIYEARFEPKKVLEIIARLERSRNIRNDIVKLIFVDYIMNNFELIRCVKVIDDVFYIAALLIVFDKVDSLSKIIEMHPNIVNYSSMSHLGSMNLHNIAVSHDSCKCICYLFRNHSEQAFNEYVSESPIEMLIKKDLKSSIDGRHLILEFGFDPNLKVKRGLNGNTKTLLQLCKIHDKASLEENWKDSFMPPIKNLSIN